MKWHSTKRKDSCGIYSNDSIDAEAEIELSNIEQSGLKVSFQ
jgi:hypothetical protein